MQTMRLKDSILCTITLLALSLSPLEAFAPLAPLLHSPGFAHSSPIGARDFPQADFVRTRKVPTVCMAETVSGNKRLFLGGLPFKATEMDVREMFEVCGDVAAVNMRANQDGRPAGYAFLTFKEAESVPRALLLDGSEMMGRWIKVQEADGSKGKNSNQTPREKPEGCKKIFAWNLPYDTEEEDVREFFGACGKIANVQIPMEEATGRIKGHCFVVFAKTEASDKAVSLAGQVFGGREIRVDFATSRTRGRPSRAR